MQEKRGTKDQLLMDKQVLKHCKKHQRNLAMGWIDYKKAYDMVLHRWLTEAMKMVGMQITLLTYLKTAKRLENRTDSM